jgi:hypothetical protein
MTECKSSSTSISLHNYTIIFALKLNNINNAGNAVLLSSVKPGDQLGRIKITKHDDDKGRVEAGGDPTENGLSN